MGAWDFYTTSDALSAREAFYQARDQAAWESGHGGYTGTLAEKDGFVMFKEYPAPLPVEATKEQLAVRDASVRAWMDDGDERIDDKWGPAGCIPMQRLADGRVRYLFFGYAPS